MDFFTDRPYDTPLIPLPLFGGATNNFSAVLNNVTKQAEEDITSVKDVTYVEPYANLTAAMRLLANNENKLRNTTIQVVDGMSRVLIGQTAQSSIGAIKINMMDIVNNGTEFVDTYQKIFKNAFSNQFHDVDAQTLQTIFLKIKKEQKSLLEMYRVLSAAIKDLNTAAPHIRQNRRDFTTSDVQTMSNFDIFEKVDFEIRKQPSNELSAPWSVAEPQFAKLFEKYPNIPHGRTASGKFYRKEYATSGTTGPVFSTTWSGGTPGALDLENFEKELGSLLNDFFIKNQFAVSKNQNLKQLKPPFISNDNNSVIKLFSTHLIPDSVANANILLSVHSTDSHSGAGSYHPQSTFLYKTNDQDNNYVLYTGSGALKLPDFQITAGNCCGSKRLKSGKSQDLKDLPVGEKRRLIENATSKLAEMSALLRKISALNTVQISSAFLDVKKALEDFKNINTIFSNNKKGAHRKVILTKQDLVSLYNRFVFNIVDNSSFSDLDRKANKEFSDNLMAYIKIFESVENTQKTKTSTTYSAPVPYTANYSVVNLYTMMAAKINQSSLNLFTSGVSSLVDANTVFTIGKINQTIGNPPSFEIIDNTTGRPWTPVETQKISPGKVLKFNKGNAAVENLVTAELSNYIDTLGLLKLKAERDRYKTKQNQLKVFLNQAESALNYLESVDSPSLKLTNNILLNYILHYTKSPNRSRSFICFDPTSDTPNGFYSKFKNVETSNLAIVLKKNAVNGGSPLTVEQVMGYITQTDIISESVMDYTMGVFLQNLSASDRHPAFCISDKPTPRITEIPDPSKFDATWAQTINLKGQSSSVGVPFHYNIITAVFRLLGLLENNINTSAKDYGAQEIINNLGKCITKFTKRIDFLDRCKDISLLSKTFSYDIGYAPRVGLLETLNLINFELLLQQPVEANIICMGPSGSGKTVNLFGYKQENIKGVTELLKKIPNCQYFAYDYYARCFGFVESFQAACENAKIINYSLVRSTAGSSKPEPSMKFLNAAGAVETDIQFETVKDSIDSVRKKNNLILDTKYKYFGAEVGNAESSRSVFVFAGREGSTGPLKKIMDIPGYEYVRAPEYLNPFWVASRMYEFNTPENADSIKQQTLLPFGKFATSIESQISSMFALKPFESWCSTIIFNFGFTSDVSENLLKWGISPSEGDQTLNLWTLLMQMHKYSIIGGRGELQLYYQQSTVISRLNVTRYNKKNWREVYLLEDGKEAQYSDNFDTTLPYLKPPAVKWQLFDKYYCNMVLYRHTFLRFLRGVYAYYLAFVAHKKTDTETYVDRLDAFCKKYAVNEEEYWIMRISQEALFYNHINYWTQTATKSRQSSILLDEPSAPETISMAIYKCLLAICDVNLKKIANFQNLRERVIIEEEFAEIVDTIPYTIKLEEMTVDDSNTDVSDRLGVLNNSDVEMVEQTMDNQSRLKREDLTPDEEKQPTSKSKASRKKKKNQQNNLSSFGEFSDEDDEFDPLSQDKPYYYGVTGMGRGLVGCGIDHKREYNKDIGPTQLPVIPSDDVLSISNKAMSQIISRRIINMDPIEVYRLRELLHFGQNRSLDQISKLTPYLRPTNTTGDKTYLSKSDSRNSFVTMYNGAKFSGYLPFMEINKPQDADPDDAIAFDITCLV